jgi:hypothetical protein
VRTHDLLINFINDTLRIFTHFQMKITDISDNYAITNIRQDNAQTPEAARLHDPCCGAAAKVEQEALRLGSLCRRFITYTISPARR